MIELSTGEARRLAVAAQGFGAERPAAVTTDDIKHLVDRLGLVQIDSVNVLERAHYLPFFARLGSYDKTLLDQCAYREHRIFEHWGHEASFIPVESYGLFRHRMDAAKARQRMHGIEGHPGYLAEVLAEVRERGPLSAGELSNPGERTGPWWGYSKGKFALEWHYRTGDLAIRTRRNFTRVYDLTERVLPPEVLAQPPIAAHAAHRRMLLISARALGVATSRDLADYFRLGLVAARPRLKELIETGELEPVEVEGWTEPAFMLPGTTMPPIFEGSALLSPFDSLVWERARTERLFGFRYRIEIYTPRPKRQFGYYVLPFLLGNALVGRVDLKANRKEKALEVLGAFLEPGQPAAKAGRTLNRQLNEMAAWLGLEQVRVYSEGPLSKFIQGTTPAS